MRKTTKTPGEKIVKDIKRATRKHYSSEDEDEDQDCAGWPTWQGQYC